MLDCVSASGAAFINTRADAAVAIGGIRDDPLALAYYDGTDTLYVWARLRGNGLRDRVYLQWDGRHSLRITSAAVDGRAQQVALRAVSSRSSASQGSVVLFSLGGTFRSDHEIDQECLRRAS
jgi:hypothetical protein